MFVIKENEEHRWEVGYYTPDQGWYGVAAYEDQTKAMAICSWLNGGPLHLIQPRYLRDRILQPSRFRKWWRW